MFEWLKGNLYAEDSSLDLFGVFDGHGGKQAATFAARHLTEYLIALLGEREATAKGSRAHAPTDLREANRVDDRCWKAWEQQFDLTARLPEAISDAFALVQKHFFDSLKVGSFLLLTPTTARGEATNSMIREGSY